MWAASCLASCCAACACEACRTAVGSIGRRSARIAYCGLFALSLFASWALREVAAPLLQSIPWINHFHKTPDREWFETDAVLRVSLGNFLFFTILAVIMAGIKDQKDPRDKLHHGGWMAKIFCWAVIVFLMFFVPNGVVSFYESISKFGFGLSLLVQVVLLLDFVHRWNENWVAKDEQFWYMALLVVSVVCYIATFSFSGLLFYWSTPSGHDRGLNLFFIVFTLMLASSSAENYSATRCLCSLQYHTPRLSHNPGAVLTSLGCCLYPTVLTIVTAVGHPKNLHIMPFWILFECVMTVRLMRAALTGLLELEGFNQWVVTKKVGNDLEDSEVPLLQRTRKRLRDRRLPAICFVHVELSM